VGLAVAAGVGEVAAPQARLQRHSSGSTGRHGAIGAGVQQGRRFSHAVEEATVFAVPFAVGGILWIIIIVLVVLLVLGALRGRM
jgi:hypothetical protein